MIDVGNRPLPSGKGLDISQRLTASTGGTDILHLCEGDGGYETLGLPRLGDLGVEFVDLLERKALGLVDGKVDESAANQTESTPDEEHLGSQIGVTWSRVYHVGSGVGNGPVEKPVGGRGHGEGLGTCFEREELSGHDPRHWTPRGGEEENVDAHKGDEDLVGDERGLPGGGTDDGDNQLADAHTNGSKHEKWTTTPLLNQIKTGKGRDYVYDVGDQGDDKGILDSGTLEEGSTVVENEVDPSKLLQSLQSTTGGKTLAHGTSETLNVRRLAQAHFIIVVGFDLRKLFDQGRVVEVESPKSGQALRRGLTSATLDVISRSLRQD